jgi:selenoprotein W-related protein
VARLLDEHEDDIDTIELVTGVGGIFDVHVDGTLVFTKSMLGRYPEPGEVVPLVEAQLAS